MDEAYDLIRAVRDQRYKYIRNLMPGRTRAQNIDYMNKMPTMIDMRRLNAVGKLGTVALRQYFEPTKPDEELYDLDSDPFEVKNLAADPAHAAALKRLREELENWQDKIGDQGLVPEALLVEAMRPGNRYESTADPVISIGKPTGDDGVRVMIGSETPGASIAYAIGGGNRPKWQLYSRPFSVPKGTQLRAVACRIGYRDSQRVRRVVGD